MFVFKATVQVEKGNAVAKLPHFISHFTFGIVRRRRRFAIICMLKNVQLKTACNCDARFFVFFIRMKSVRRMVCLNRGSCCFSEWCIIKWKPKKAFAQKNLNWMKVLAMNSILDGFSVESQNNKQKFNFELSLRKSDKYSLAIKSNHFIIAATALFKKPTNSKNKNRSHAETQFVLYCLFKRASCCYVSPCSSWRNPVARWRFYPSNAVANVIWIRATNNWKFSKAINKINNNNQRNCCGFFFVVEITHFSLFFDEDDDATATTIFLSFTASVFGKVGASLIATYFQLAAWMRFPC